MKVTVKTTQQKVFNIDAEATETIGAIKAKIEQYQGFAASSQKVIYSGKILADDKTLESCGFKEKDFLVLMVSKPKPTPSPMPATASTPAPAPAPAAAAPTPSSETAVPAAQAPAATTPTSASSISTDTPAAGSSFLTGSALQTSIQSMIDMGFERDQVMRALRASFNNPERAVEYLMTGIPAHLEAEAAGSAAPRPPASNTPSSAPTTPAATPAAAPPSNQPQNLFQLAQQQQQQQSTGVGLGAGAGTGVGGAPQLNLAALANTPQMQQLREHLASNPEAIQPLLQSLAAQNPALAQTLAQHPEVLMELLGGELAGEDGDLPPGTQAINVTEEERAAIERLEALGFPRHAVIEAYFACDKNEELAANYLFDSGNDN